MSRSASRQIASSNEADNRNEIAYTIQKYLKANVIRSEDLEPGSSFVVTTDRGPMQVDVKEVRQYSLAVDIAVGGYELNYLWVVWP